MKPKTIIESLLQEAGIKINGDSPHDIQVHDERFYKRVLTHGSLGLGESYMDGWWDCERLDEFFNKILRAELEKKIKYNFRLLPRTLSAIIFNLQKKSRVFQVGEKHYDIGNELYQNMLGERMVYTCGYWKDVKNLDNAQEAKLDLVCRKLGLKAGQKILDIGCGWGSFAKYAAEKYSVKVVGITVSKEQVRLAEKLCQGLPVEIRLQDYRDVDEKFDNIVSLGMFEHVGHKNYRTYMKTVNRCLKDHGLFLLHTIGWHKTELTAEDWLNKYIFPNSILPSAKQIMTAADKLFIIEDWHSFGSDYDKTLMAWRANFVRNWDKIKLNYNEKFYRMWKYYLLSSAGSFRSRKNQLWQIIFSKKGVYGGYQSIR